METCGAEDLSKVRLVILGGEPVVKRDVERYQKHFSPNCLFANLSGQSESSLNLVYFLNQGAALTGNAIPMGYPVEDTEVLLLDAQGHTTELYGEIGIRSGHVALGYWNRPELTAAAFVADPDGGCKRLYRTGDMGRIMADGSISFVGRKDGQVKIRGLRIELGEIEAVLEGHPNVKEVAVICDEGSAEKGLAAYWVASGEPIPSSADLRSFLKEKLPAYMIPSSFMHLDALPLTPSGKLNRRALPAIEQGKDRASRELVPARNNVELQLTEMWEQVIGVKPIGIRDDFFDLGGHSLMGVRLFALMEKAFGQRIPLSTLLQAPTIEQLATVLREEKGLTQSSSLVPIQPRGSLRPLFCVHGHFGEVLFYRPLSQCLGPDQPFFALQAQGQNGSSHHNIEAMAADYLTEIRKVQPEGPYFLGGFCFGALVAFEMAHQLRARNEKVAFLGLFLGHAPKLDRVTFLRNRVALHWGQLRRAGMRTKLTELARNSTRKLESLHWRLKYNLFRNIVSESSPLFQNIPEMNHQRSKIYVPRFYPGKMTVFLSGETAPDFRLDPNSDLAGMDAREIDLRRVPGERDTMLHEPFVRIVAEQLGVCLRAAAVRSQGERVGMGIRGKR
jgi:thioesterase domain-containing protein/acyl carrier protein